MAELWYAIQLYLIYTYSVIIYFLFQKTTQNFLS